MAGQLCRQLGAFRGVDLRPRAGRLADQIHQGHIKRAGDLGQVARLGVRDERSFEPRDVGATQAGALGDVVLIEAEVPPPVQDPLGDLSDIRAMLVAHVTQSNIEGARSYPHRASFSSSLCDYLTHLPLSSTMCVTV